MQGWHTHRRSAPPKQEPAPPRGALKRGDRTMAKDPVCGMEMKEGTALASSHQGTTYYFCSASCKERFDKDPAQFAGSKGGAEHGGHHQRN